MLQIETSSQAKESESLKKVIDERSQIHQQLLDKFFSL
jgi:hypothetical protein